MKSKSSYLLAGAVALAVAGWMLSDDLLGKADGIAPQELCIGHVIEHCASGKCKIGITRKWIISVGSRG